VSQSSGVQYTETACKGAASPENTMALQDNQRVRSVLPADASDPISQQKSDNISPHYVDVEETSHSSITPSESAIYLPGSKTTFMSLLLKIRIMIYELAFARGFIIEITSRNNKTLRRQRPGSR
jgi:hypothetical protein